METRIAERCGRNWRGEGTSSRRLGGFAGAMGCQTELGCDQPPEPGSNRLVGVCSVHNAVNDQLCNVQQRHGQQGSEEAKEFSPPATTPGPDSIYFENRGDIVKGSKPLPPGTRKAVLLCHTWPNSMVLRNLKGGYYVSVIGSQSCRHKHHSG